MSRISPASSAEVLRRPTSGPLLLRAWAIPSSAQKNPLGLEQVHRGLWIGLGPLRGLQRCGVGEAFFHIHRKVARVKTSQRHGGAAIQDRVGVDFLFGQSGLQFRVEGDAGAKVIAFVALQALLQLGPRQRCQLGSALDPEPEPLARLILLGRGR